MVSLSLLRGITVKFPHSMVLTILPTIFPTYVLSRAENYQTCLAFFKALRLLKYPLQGLVCDDNQNIYTACRYVYPKAVVQLCHNHYKESLRAHLAVRTDPSYQSFMRSLESLFGKKLSTIDLQKRAFRITKTFGNDPRCLGIMTEIFKRREVLFGYSHLRGVPTTTNLIESFNSHLQGRLTTIKGFESFKHADLWLNGYFIKRRTRIFTDCTKRFKYLNGKTSLEKSLNPSIELPSLF